MVKRLGRDQGPRRLRDNRARNGAVVAAFGWPANLQLDAVYPYTTVDTTVRKTLNGARWGTR